MSCYMESPYSKISSHELVQRIFVDCICLKYGSICELLDAIQNFNR